MPVTSDCQRCNGTGVYNGTRRDGSTYSGACFACQGGGPRYRRGAYRAPMPATNLVNPIAQPGQPGQGALIAQPVWTPRQQANLDAFAVAQPLAWVWLVNNAPSSDFAASLRNGIARYGNLTPRQLACVMRNVDAAPPVAPVATAGNYHAQRMASLPSPGPVAPDHSVSNAIIARAVERDAIAQPVTPSTVNLDRVRSAMESARASGLRKVRLTFGDVTLKLSGSSFRSGAGMILCYYNGTYRGYVDAGNVFHARMNTRADESTLDAFRAVGVDPRAAAATHGHDTGYCACCRRLLTDPPSVMAGIGPVCIRRFGWSF